MSGFFGPTLNGMLMDMDIRVFTLGAGGCLCIPSQFELQHGPAEAFNRRRVNTVFTTPTTSKQLHGVHVRPINFGGKTFPRGVGVLEGPFTGHDELVRPFRVHAELHHQHTRARTHPATIGTGVLLRIWVFELGHGGVSSLAAMGDAGELWLEGPLVGPGYLNEPEKTDPAFITDSGWLVKEDSGLEAGYGGRLYRTGDLIRYGETLSLEFTGRQDAQAKVRGQRIELEEKTFSERKKSQRRAPETFGEMEMHDMVAQALSREGSTFRMNSNFMQLGSDLREINAAVLRCPEQGHPANHCGHSST